MDWKTFENDAIYSDLLVYWYDEWISITEDIKKGTIGIEIINIRIVLSDIINEYELNQFSSSNNRKIYIKLIENLMKENYLKEYLAVLTILKEKIERKEFQYAYITAKEIQKKLSTERFSQKLFSEVFKILKSKKSDKNNRFKISYFTKEIIVDLVSVGINIEDIQKLLKQSFATYINNGKEYIILYNELPESIGTPDSKSFNIKAKEFIDKLTVTDRLEKFKSKLSPEKVEYIFVYPIWGVSSTILREKEYILDCYLYSPEYELIFDEEETYFDETFKVFNDEDSSKDEIEENYWENKSRLNLMVNVVSTSNEAAKEMAEDKYKKVLNLLNWKYSNMHHEYFWDGQYIGKNEKTKTYFGTWTAYDEVKNAQRRRQISKNSPKYINKNKFKELSNLSKIIQKLEEKNKYYEANTLLNVIAILSETKWEANETKLLNYWIVLESLANIAKNNRESVFDFVKKIIPNIYFLHEKYVPLIHLFWQINLYSTRSFTKDSTVDFPEELLKEIGIYEIHSEDARVSMKPLYKNLDKLDKYTTKQQFLDEIESTINFYNNNDISLSRLKKKREEVELTIDYIYKTRNQIVHNGFVDKNLIPYLVSFAESYAKSLLERIFSVYDENSHFDLETYFIKELFEGELLEKQLASSTHYELIE